MIKYGINCCGTCMLCRNTGTRCKRLGTISSEFPLTSGQPTDRNKVKVFLHNAERIFKRQNAFTFYSPKKSKIIRVYDKIENFILITVL